MCEAFACAQRYILWEGIRRPDDATATVLEREHLGADGRVVQEI